MHLSLIGNCIAVAVIRLQILMFRLGAQQSTEKEIGSTNQHAGLAPSHNSAVGI